MIGSTAVKLTCLSQHASGNCAVVKPVGSLLRVGPLRCTGKHGHHIGHRLQTAATRSMPAPFSVVNVTAAEIVIKNPRSDFISKSLQ
jgi:hypothetical protein